MNQYYDFIECCKIGDIVKAKHIISQKDVNIKWNLNYAFRPSCVHGRKEVAEWLYNLSKSDGNTKINIRNESDYAFRFSCAKGYKEVAEWLYNLSKSDGNTKININARSQYAFRRSCVNGRKEIAEWLYNLSKSDGNTKININIDSDYAFRYSCENGRKEVAEWLYNLSKSDGNTKINIRNESDYAFTISCVNKRIEVAKWLASLCPDYELVIENNEIKSYKIITLKDKLKDKTTDEIIKILKIKTEPKSENLNEQCYVCLDEPNLKYVCNHLICLNCMIQWNINENHQSCDLCKKPIEYNLMTLFI